MLPDPVVKLLRDIYVHQTNEEVQQKLRETPEELLIALLQQIKADLPDISSTLAFTVEMGAAGVLESVKQQRAEYARKERKKK